MQRSIRFTVLSIVLLVLGLLIGPAGAQEAPESPEVAACLPGAGYASGCDVDQDGDVDIFDIQLTAGRWNTSGAYTSSHTHWGETWTGTGSHGLRLDNTAASGSNFGLVGTSASNAGVGLYGYASATSGFTRGVLGLATSTEGRGLSGSATAASGVTYGAYGSAASTSGIGVYGGVTAGSGVTYGVFGESASNTGRGVYGHATSGSGSTYGVWGQSDSTSGYGVYGGTSASSGVTYGVYGTSSSTSGIGVRGIVAGSSGTTYGVYGTSASTSGVGVRGLATASSGTTYGVYGESVSSSGAGVTGSSDAGAGVNGYSDSGIGVFGSSDTGYAGFFWGDVAVIGMLSKGGGSFKIDHPLDPANQYLYHSFVESPDMKNIYDGVATLDANGEATVTLPDWFEALNQDFRYQLTPIGGWAPLYIAQEIRDNTFHIAGGEPDMKVSWMVTGIRQDAYANAHRIPVEEAKPADERGLYLYPVELGQPAELGLDARRQAAPPDALRAARPASHQEELP